MRTPRLRRLAIASHLRLSSKRCRHALAEFNTPASRKQNGPWPTTWLLFLSASLFPYGNKSCGKTGSSPCSSVSTTASRKNGPSASVVTRPKRICRSKITGGFEWSRVKRQLIECPRPVTRSDDKISLAFWRKCCGQGLDGSRFHRGVEKTRAVVQSVTRIPSGNGNKKRGEKSDRIA